jgi:hypothetical protein
VTSPSNRVGNFSRDLAFNGGRWQRTYYPDYTDACRKVWALFLPPEREEKERETERKKEKKRERERERERERCVNILLFLIMCPRVQTQLLGMYDILGLSEKGNMSRQARGVWQKELKVE